MSSSQALGPSATARAAYAGPEGAVRRLADLPGPRPLPVLGNLPQLHRERIHLDIEALVPRYGPLFLLHFGRLPVMVVSDHELTAQLLRARPDDFRRSTRLEATGREMGLKPGLFGAEGARWHAQRRMVMAAFSPQQVRSYFPSLLKVTRRFEARWQRAAARGEPIDLQSDLMRYTVDTITGLAFGQEVNTIDAADDVIQRHLDEIFPALFRRLFSVVPYWRLFKLPADRRLDRSIAAVHAAIGRFIEQARARLRADPARRENPPNLLESFIVASEMDGSGVGDEDVVGNVLTMLLAGEDTTANTLAWMIELLHRHPEALRRATAEVQAAAPRGLDDFTPEVMASLDYVEACAHEAMRLKPVAPFLPMEALRDTVVAGVAVPAGTMIWNVLRHDSVSDRWVEHGREFRPERWLDPARSPKGVAMPFGSGPRVCPGRYLALLEIKLAMAMLLSSFRIESVDTPDGHPARELMAFTMGPAGLTMTLRPHPVS